MTIPRKFWRGKMRQPTFFTPDKIFRDGLAFGKNRENAWHFSVSDRFFRLTLVKCLLSYEVLKSFVRKVRKPAVSPSCRRSYFRSILFMFLKKNDALSKDSLAGSRLACGNFWYVNFPLLLFSFEKIPNNSSAFITIF